MERWNFMKNYNKNASFALKLVKGEYASINPGENSMLHNNNGFTMTLAFYPKDIKGSFAIASQEECFSTGLDNKKVYFEIIGLKKIVIDKMCIPIREERWNTIVVTFDKSKLKIYINGILDYDKIIIGNINNSKKEIILGGEFDGYLESFKIYDYAINKEEAAKDRNINQIDKNHTNILFNFNKAFGEKKDEGKYKKDIIIHGKIYEKTALSLGRNGIAKPKNEKKIRETLGNECFSIISRIKPIPKDGEKSILFSTATCKTCFDGQFAVFLSNFSSENHEKKARIILMIDGYNYMTQTALSYDKWSTIAITYNIKNLQIQIFLDGEKTEEIPISYPISKSNEEFCIGNSLDVEEGNYFNGLIDSISILNTVLNKEQLNLFGKSGCDVNENFISNYIFYKGTATDEISFDDIELAGQTELVTEGTDGKYEKAESGEVNIVRSLELNKGENILLPFTNLPNFKKDNYAFYCKIFPKYIEKEKSTIFSSSDTVLYVKPSTNKNYGLLSLAVNGEEYLIKKDLLLPYENWIDIGISYKKSDKKITVYINGEEKDSFLFNTNPEIKKISIGGTSNSEENFVGYIDSLGIFEIDLSLEDYKYFLNNPPNVFEEHIKALYDFSKPIALDKISRKKINNLNKTSLTLRENTQNEIFPPIIYKIPPKPSIKYSKAKLQQARIVASMFDKFMVETFSEAPYDKIEDKNEKGLDGLPILDDYRYYYIIEFVLPLPSVVKLFMKWEKLDMLKRGAEDNTTLQTTLIGDSMSDSIPALADMERSLPDSNIKQTLEYCDARIDGLTDNILNINAGLTEQAFLLNTESFLILLAIFVTGLMAAFILWQILNDDNYKDGNGIQLNSISFRLMGEDAKLGAIPLANDLCNMIEEEWKSDKNTEEKPSVAAYIKNTLGNTLKFTAEFIYIPGKMPESGEVTIHGESEHFGEFEQKTKAIADESIIVTFECNSDEWKKENVGMYKEKIKWSYTSDEVGGGNLKNSWHEIHLLAKTPCLPYNLNINEKEEENFNFKTLPTPSVLRVSAEIIRKNAEDEEEKLDSYVDYAKKAVTWLHTCNLFKYASEPQYSFIDETYKLNFNIHDLNIKILNQQKLEENNRVKIEVGSLDTSLLIANFCRLEGFNELVVSNLSTNKSYYDTSKAKTKKIQISTYDTSKEYKVFLWYNKIKTLDQKFVKNGIEEKNYEMGKDLYVEQHWCADAPNKYNDNIKHYLFDGSIRAIDTRDNLKCHDICCTNMPFTNEEKETEVGEKSYNYYRELLFTKYSDCEVNHYIENWYLENSNISNIEYKKISPFDFTFHDIFISLCPAFPDRMKFLKPTKDVFLSIQQNQNICHSISFNSIVNIFIQCLAKLIDDDDRDVDYFISSMNILFLILSQNQKNDYEEPFSSSLNELINSLENDLSNLLPSIRIIIKILNSIIGNLRVGDSSWNQSIHSSYDPIEWYYINIWPTDPNPDFSKLYLLSSNLCQTPNNLYTPIEQIPFKGLKFPSCPGFYIINKVDNDRIQNMIDYLNDYLIIALKFDVVAIANTFYVLGSSSNQNSLFNYDHKKVKFQPPIFAFVSDNWIQLN